MLVENESFNQDIIVVLDFGSHYNQQIARRIRELGVYSEIHPHTITAEEMKKLNPKGIILSGGPGHIHSEDALTIDKNIFSMGIPILGICYGMQIIAAQFGGHISRNGERRYEPSTLQIKDGGPELFKGLPAKMDVLMSYGDVIEEMPAGFVVDAESGSVPIAAISNTDNKIYGIQFHPEAVQTEQGSELLGNFLFGLCHCTEDWTMQQFIDTEIKKIQDTVGSKKVLCALSGGVDSSVVAVLVHKAIGDQLTCIFVDHGLLRKGEAESVMETFTGKFHMNVIKVDAQERFLTKLKGVTDPEQKRKIIGNEFIYVFDDEASKLEGIEFLAQGTIYPDIIESGTATSQTIKSHHNVGGLPEDMNFTLIEPLKALFKDEVRQVGTELGIPDEIVWRQPFPGPGLGVRVLGEVTEEKLEIVRESDYILREEIKNAGLDKDIWQYFTVLPGIRSVGVRSESRTYDYTVGIRAVHSTDGMTSDWARIPYEVLEKISTRIVHEVDHVNRVVYDITTKPPSTIEWE
ncbi:glutamine-hydrolyzing GMP synthase [Siminovitchia sediminis]|uniref:GMP synthase [glutamine-hydrolyzing] n=1 Tax=Siminovitchia sediminis TaxID=1274353 RepID=A0ABW4KJ46_9BACI